MLCSSSLYAEAGSLAARLLAIGSLVGELLVKWLVRVESLTE